MSKPWKENKVVRLGRSVMEKQLLVWLEDKSKVALLITEDDLNVLVMALDGFSDSLPGGHEMESKCKDFAKDLQQLRKEAFGK